jgi:hypothetical protein
MDVDDIKAEPIHNDESFETKETLAVSTFNRPGSSSLLGNNNNSNNGRASVSSPSAASSATPSPLSPHLQLTPPNVSIASIADSATPFSVSSSISSSKCTSNSRAWSRDC